MAPPPGGGFGKKKHTHRVFGQATQSSTTTRYQRQFGGGSGMGKSHSRLRTYNDNDNDNSNKSASTEDDVTAAQRRRVARERARRIEQEQLGVQPLAPGTTERGWLYNIIATTVRFVSHRK